MTVPGLPAILAAESGGESAVAEAAMLVLTTCGDAAQADALATRLVGAREAACVNRIDNVSSTYRWDGAVETGRETLLLIKTTEDRIADVEHTIQALSSYELPELITVRLEGGSAAYLQWLADSTAEQGT